jgi:hypothetical protein
LFKWLWRTALSAVPLSKPEQRRFIHAKGHHSFVDCPKVQGHGLSAAQHAKGCNTDCPQLAVSAQGMGFVVQVRNGFGLHFQFAQFLLTFILKIEHLEKNDRFPNLKNYLPSIFAPKEPQKFPINQQVCKIRLAKLNNKSIVNKICYL